MVILGSLKENRNIYIAATENNGDVLSQLPDFFRQESRNPYRAAPLYHEMVLV